MRDSFYIHLAQWKFYYYYYDLYLQRLGRVKFWTDMATGLISIIAVSGLSFSGKAKLLWVIAILATQFASLVLDKTNFYQRINNLKFYCVEADEFLLEAEYTWRTIECGSINNDEELNKLIRNFDKSHALLFNKYVTPLSLPEIKKLVTIADQSANLYLDNKFKTGDVQIESGVTH